MRKIMSLALAALLSLALLLPALAVGEEPRIVTMGSCSVFVENWLDQEIMRILQDDLNVRIDYTYYDRDKFSLLLAGGELPDIVVGRMDYLPSIIQNGMALNLDTVKEKMPYMNSELFAARNELVRMLMGGEAQELLFAAPGLGPERVGAGKIPGRGYTIRWDYYKEIGCPPINSDDDFLAALIEIHKLHPTHEDGTPMYGIGQYNEIGRFYGRGAYLKDVAQNPWTFTNYLYFAGMDDCVLYNGYINTERSAFWKDVTFYNRLYREGLFDLDSFTMTIDDWTAKIRSGYYYADTSNYGGMYDEQVKRDPDTLAGYVVVPSEGAVVHANKLQLTGTAPTNYIFISSKAKNMDAAIEVLDYLHNPDYIRTIFTGVQGKEWDYDEDGVPFMFEETIARRATNDVEWQNTGFGRSTVAWWNMAQPTAHHPDGYSYDLMEEPAYRSLALTPLYQDFCEYYEVSYPGEALMRVVEEGKTIDLTHDYAQTVAAGVSDIPMDIRRIMDACNDIIYRAMPKLVMAEDDAAFAAVQAEVMANLESAGEQTAWAWCEAEFNRVRDLVTPAFEEGLAYYRENYLGEN